MSVPDEVMKLKDGKIIVDKLKSMVAVQFVQATANDAGTYVVYQGQVYYLPDGHTANTTWENTTKVGPTNIGDELSGVKTAIHGIGVVSVDNFGAKGDGVTDDTEAIRAAINAGYEIKFGNNKTYLVTEPIIINKDIKLIGGRNTWIKNLQLANDETTFSIGGELKTETTLTTDYTTKGNTDNSGNRFTLNDMSKVAIGDILVIEATDQYYSYARQYYYLGGTLLVSDIYEGHIYTSNSLPFDIENTENVTIRVYSAPTAIIEGLNFVSDINERERFYYRYCIELKRCKNSVVKNCKTTNTDMGIMVQQSVNTLIDGVTLAKSIYDNTITADGYGIFIYSSTNTIVQRVLSICSQGCIDLGGTIPNIDTFIYNCNLNSECRPIGIDMHENSYNVVIEDCTLGGLLLYGTATVNRCRFIRNNRVNSDPSGIVFGGSHNEKFSKVRITNCIFDAAQQTAGVSFSAPVTQDPIQSFNNIIGTVEIENCIGGALFFNPQTSATILSNTIKSLVIKNWEDCYEFYHTTSGNVVEYMQLIDTTFTKVKWANIHTDAINLDGINYLHILSDNPQRDKLIVKLNGKGKTYDKLQKGNRINVTANSESDHFIVCGKNIASNKVEDYNIGDVTGTSGNPLSRTTKTGFDNALSVNGDGNLVFVQPDNTTKWALYNKCMLYVEKASVVRMSCKIKNTGETSGITMRAFIAVVNAETGLVTYRNNGDTAQATESGVTITHSYTVQGNSYVLCYVTCSTAVANAETTIEDFVAEIYDIDMGGNPIQYTDYVGNSLDGSGYMETVEGVNNIMSSATAFTASFKSDLI